MMMGSSEVGFFSRQSSNMIGSHLSITTGNKEKPSSKMSSEQENMTKNVVCSKLSYASL